ncbi:MAG: aminoacyl-tRNA hydrolase [Candidatus Omnitrophica bacterium]|nr:aminoacyl-tRNA hydrolase [Candidatus Omnitrophota bacterium]
MKLIVGLGNPGKEYEGSRHNIGFAVIRSLAEDLRAAFKKEKYSFCLSARLKVGGENLILAMPLTYMNLSGSAVYSLVKRHKIDPDDLLIVCDDMDLGLGSLRIKPQGSCGGHRGLRSIIDALGSDDFNRLRIGIGRPAHRLRAEQRISDGNRYGLGPDREDSEIVKYVLSPFQRKEREAIKEVLARAVDCCMCWVGEGIEKCMNRFNGVKK